MHHLLEGGIVLFSMPEVKYHVPNILHSRFFLRWKCLFGEGTVSCKKFCNVHFDLFCLITVSDTSWLLKLLQWIFRRQFFILKLLILVRRQYVGMGNITIQSPRFTIPKAVKIVSGCTGIMQFYQWRMWDKSSVLPQYSHCPKEEHIEVAFILQWISCIFPRMTLLLAHHESKKGLNLFCHQWKEAPFLLVCAW